MTPQTRLLVLGALLGGTSLSWLPFCLLCDLRNVEVNLPLLCLWCLLLAGCALVVLSAILDPPKGGRSS
jgi:hypothetical protein